MFCFCVKFRYFISILKILPNYFIHTFFVFKLLFWLFLIFVFASKLLIVYFHKVFDVYWSMLWLPYLFNFSIIQLIVIIKKLFKTMHSHLLFLISNIKYPENIIVTTLVLLFPYYSWMIVYFRWCLYIDPLGHIKCVMIDWFVMLLNNGIFKIGKL